MRGKAWQEWNLLDDEERATFSDAVKAMKEVLGPGSKILAAQHFRHIVQEETEPVSAIVTRLERMFRVAYGGDKLSPDTRAAFLYGQLQEGLKQNLMNSPNVSGALTYKELHVVMTAKNEEKRESEMKKLRQYQNPPKAPASNAPPTKKTTPPSNSSSQPRPQNSERSNKVCDYCHKPGPWKQDCRKRIRSESGGKVQLALAASKANANKGSKFTISVN